MATRKKAPKAKPVKRVDRRKTTSTRITPETRAKLGAAAAQSGRSLAQEMEFRLERSFFDEDTAQYLLGFEVHSMMALRCLGDAVAKIEGETGRTWHEDWDTRQRVRVAFESILEIFGSKQPAENRLSERGRLSAQKRAADNELSGRKAVVSSVRAWMPGYKVVMELLEEE